MKITLPYLFILLLLSACFPPLSNQNQPNYSTNTNRALVTGTWHGVSISKDNSSSTVTRFVLIQESDKLKGEFYLEGNDGSLVKYGDLQGSIQQGVWGQPLQATMVIYYADYSSTKYSGTFIGDVFQGQYQYIDQSNVVQTFGQAELSLVR